MTRRLARGAVTLVAWTALGFLAGISLAVSVPTALGYRTLVVMSGSMEPTLHTGDVVVVRQIAPLDLRVGDIATFRDPNDPSRMLTHRVREISAEAGQVYVVTMGDANTEPERWHVSADGTVGRVQFHLWHLGYLMFWLRSRVGRIGFVVVPALALGALELRRIWRPVRSDPGQEPVEEVGDDAAA
ncbi:MAG: signal peptidase I [Actinobacteria bacterium]|nr:signal peptidase I [Actinomycetota bacterium]